jgi:hypothetical protein
MTSAVTFGHPAFMKRKRMLLLARHPGRISWSKPKFEKKSA